MLNKMEHTKQIIENIAIITWVTIGAIPVIPTAMICYIMGRVHGIRPKDEYGHIKYNGKLIESNTILEQSMSNLGVFPLAVMLGPVSIIPSAYIFGTTTVGFITHQFGF